MIGAWKLRLAFYHVVIDFIVDWRSKNETRWDSPVDAERWKKIGELKTMLDAAKESLE